MDGQDNLKTAAVFAVLDLQLKDFKSCKSSGLREHKKEKGKKILSIKAGGGAERYKVLIDI